MKNTIFYIGSAVILSTAVAVIFNMITLEQVGLINGIILPLLYGWYQKVLKEDVVTEKLELEDKLNRSETEINGLYTNLNNYIERYRELEHKYDTELQAYRTATENLRNGLDSEKQVEETPVKKTRTRKK